MARRRDADTASSREAENKRSARTDYAVLNLGIQSRDQHHIQHRFERRRQKWQEQRYDLRYSTSTAGAFDRKSKLDRELAGSAMAAAKRGWRRGGGRRRQSCVGEESHRRQRGLGWGGGARRASAGVEQRGRRERGTEWERRETSVLVGILLRGFLKKIPPQHLIRDGGSSISFSNLKNYSNYPYRFG
jgi:hypothetical protein